MPKELVYGDSRPYGDDSPAKSVAELRWDRDAGHVQLATKCVHMADHSTFIPEEMKEIINEAGLAHTQELRGQASDDDRTLIRTCWDGFYIDLDRRGMNELIRNLRRARDQAFGRDE